QGGAIDSSASCREKGADTIFKTDCNSKQNLQNNERWDFTDASKCDIPSDEVNPLDYFVFNMTKWSKDIETGRDLDVTVYYDCTCTDPETLEETFQLSVP
ncbi:hypothetical protein DRQ32_11345, partial [bacterium]